MVNKYMKICLIVVVTKETQIETTVILLYTHSHGYHKKDINECWQRCAENESLIHC